MHRARRDTFRRKDLTKINSNDLNLSTYDEILCCFEGIRDENLDFKPSLIFNDGDEGLLRNSNTKKGSRAKTEWRFEHVFEEREHEKKKASGSGVKSCLCLDFRGIFFGQVLVNVRCVRESHCHPSPYSQYSNVGTSSHTECLSSESWYTHESTL